CYVFSFVCFFFFSSRRRHTRWPRDWSSDVCSSDLYKPVAGGVGFFFRTSVPILPMAISRSAITVDLSRFGSTSGEAPAPSWRARSEERRVGKEGRVRVRA